MQYDPLEPKSDTDPSSPSTGPTLGDSPTETPAPTSPTAPAAETASAKDTATTGTAATGTATPASASSGIGTSGTGTSAIAARDTAASDQPIRHSSAGATPAATRPRELRVRTRPRRDEPSGWKRGWRAALRRPEVRWGLPIAAVVLIGALGGVVFAAAIHIPEVESLIGYRPSLITQVYSQGGQPFAQFHRQRRIQLQEGQVPEVLQQAIVAVEDSKFFHHGGIDAEGVLRAAWTNFQAGEVREGASTLTMQLARALYLTRDRTWKRKVEEAFTAVELEKRYSKQQLLTLYCNLFNVGHGNYGMEAGARYYFGKSVGDLEVHEAAMLAGIVQRPSDYSPYRRPQRVLERRNWVLRRMQMVGYLSEAEYQAARLQPLGVIPQRKEEAIAPFFGEEVRRHLEQAFGTTQMLEGGLRVQTTLDLDIQRAAETSMQRHLLYLDKRKGWRGPLQRLPEEELETAELPSWDGTKPAPENWFEGIVLESDRERARVRIQDEVYDLDADGLVSPDGRAWTYRRRPDQVLAKGDVAWFRIEPPEAEGGLPTLFLEQIPELESSVLVLESGTGAIRAMVGGWSFERSKFNRATQAHRQVGSAFKLFVFGAALESGYTAADTLFDAPTYFPGSTGEPEYRPRNYDREYHGMVTLRRALEKSLNLTAVKLMDMVGAEQTIDFARRSGIQSELMQVASLALGVADLTPLELAASYAAVANQGIYVKPYFIERVTDPDGKVLESHHPETHGAMDPQIAYVLTHMLEGVIDRGTAFAIHDLPIALAGKTGTTDNYSDAWFVGFTPRYTILTWVGYDKMRPIGRNMTGAEAALPIWRGIVEAGLEDGWLQEGETFDVPPGIEIAPVERWTGLRPVPGAAEIIQEAFIHGTEPVRYYNPDQARIMELPWYQQRPFYIPKQNERMPEDFEDVARIDDWTGAED